MLRRLALLLLCVGAILISLTGVAQARDLTQKDIDIFIKIQPVMAKVVTKAVKDYQKMTQEQKECTACKAGNVSPYRKELEPTLAENNVTAEEFAFINGRVIALYSLVSSEHVMAQAQQDIENEKSGFWGSIKKLFKGAVEKKQNVSLSQYSASEIALIEKNRPQLDATFQMIEKELSAQ